jgi:hypothetical protein
MKKRTDQEICVDAVREARRILSKFSDPGGPHDAAASLYQIMTALDNQIVDAALERIDGRKHFGIVTVERYSVSEDAAKDDASS